MVSNGTWQVHITRQCSQHNHVVGPDIYKTYHEVRLVKDKQVLAGVDTLRRAGANRKRILEYILEHSSVEPTMKDVHNLIARLEKEARGDQTLEERVVDYLKGFSKDGTIAKVFINNGIAEVITLQTGHMRAMFENFPEVVLIDATHDTNSSNYKLFSFTVHDAYGKGQHVQHALIENERKETLRTAIQQFKEACPSFGSIKCIMIDKDFTELSVLEEEFPGARVFLCHFHVVQCLHREISKSEYDFDSWTKSEMKQLARLLLSASTQAKYDAVIKTMKATIRSDDKRERWFHMLDKNWTSCIARWSSIYRGNIPHIGNHTNNRLESSWQKLKTLVNRSTALDDCVVALMFWQTVNERDWRSKLHRIGVCVNNTHGEEMRELSQHVSQHAMELVKQQYDFALKDSTTYHYYPLGPYILIQYVAVDGNQEVDDIPDENTLNPQNWTCSCIFQATRLLPCRHIIYYRKMTQHKQLVPVSIVNPRWLLKNVRNFEERTEVEVDSPFEIITMETRPQHKTKSQHVKYNELLAVSKQIADVVSQWGTEAHATVLELQLKVLRAVKGGSCPDFDFRSAASTNSEEADNRGSGESCAAPTEITTSTAALENVVHDAPIETVSSASPIDAVCDIDVERSVTSCSDFHCEDDTESNSASRNEQHQLKDSLRAVGEFLNEYSYNRSDSSSSDIEDCRLTPRRIVDFRLEPDEGSSDGEGNNFTQREIIDFRQLRDGDESDGTTTSINWEISKISRRPGVAKRTQAQCKAINRRAIHATAKRVEALRRGEPLISLSTVEEAVPAVTTYDDFAEPLRKLNKRLLRRASVKVTHRNKGKSVTPNECITEVLVEPTLRSCIAKIDMFKSRWKDENDETIDETDLSVAVSGVTYSVNSLRLMQRWHKLDDCFEVVDNALDWIQNGSFQYHNADSDFADIPPIEQVAQSVKTMPVLHASTMATLTLTKNQLLSEICLDETILRIGLLYDASDSFVTVPSHWLCLPPLPPECRLTSDPPAFKVLSDWSDDDENANANLLVAAINVDNNHWCGLVVDVSIWEIQIYDPQQANDRIQRVKNLVNEQVVPLLPRPLPSQRYNFKMRHNMKAQTDNYNCGVLVLVFIETAIAGVSMNDTVGANIRSAMQFFRFRYLCLNLIALDELVE